MKKGPMILLFIILIAIVGITTFTIFKTGSKAPAEKQTEQVEDDHMSEEGWGELALENNEKAIKLEEKGHYEEAITYYEEAASNYKETGRLSWVDANLIRANQIRTEIDLYVETPIPDNQELAKFEPASGTYLGLYLAGKREDANPDLVEEIYNRKHALYLTYAKWRHEYEETGTYFPADFAESAKRNGASIQVAWEPSNGLDEVADDEYVRRFAKEAKEADLPIFLRFAGEMNGEWVPWYDTPAKYIEKFRLIHDIMKEEAPNVAMVWSPNFLPRYNINDYYPGDDYVDWVGFSLYTIPYSHGREVLGGNPIDYMRLIYDEYSHKPVMISEGAVSHVSYELDKDYSEWAVSQIGNMYGFLPRMFPQVKAISYFNLDKRTTSYDNQNNNYDLGDSKIVDQRYQKIIQSPYFIDQFTLDEPVETGDTQYIPLKDTQGLSGTRSVFVYAKLPLGEQPEHVVVSQGDMILGESAEQPWDMEIDFAKITSGEPLTIIAYDKDSKALATEELMVPGIR